MLGAYRLRYSVSCGSIAAEAFSKALGNNEASFVEKKTSQRKKKQEKETNKNKNRSPDKNWDKIGIKAEIELKLTQNHE